MIFNYFWVNYQRENFIPMIIEYCLINNVLSRIFYIKLYNYVFVLNHCFQTWLIIGISLRNIQYFW